MLMWLEERERERERGKIVAFDITEKKIIL
jgi:hypothetical protein